MLTHKAVKQKHHSAKIVIYTIQTKKIVRSFINIIPTLPRMLSLWHKKTFPDLSEPGDFSVFRHNFVNRFDNADTQTVTCSFRRRISQTVK